MAVPSVVIGEAYTKLRYDRRVCARNDARPALNVFGLVSSSSDLFETRVPDRECHDRALRVLSTYADHSFSYVDAMVFATAESDDAVDRIVTVDQRDFSTYRFPRPVLIDHP